MSFVKMAMLGKRHKRHVHWKDSTGLDNHKSSLLFWLFTQNTLNYSDLVITIYTVVQTLYICQSEWMNWIQVGMTPYRAAGTQF